MPRYIDLTKINIWTDDLSEYFSDNLLFYANKDDKTNTFIDATFLFHPSKHISALLNDNDYNILKSNITNTFNDGHMSDYLDKIYIALTVNLVGINDINDINTIYGSSIAFNENTYIDLVVIDLDTSATFLSVFGFNYSVERNLCMAFCLLLHKIIANEKGNLDILNYYYLYNLVNSIDVCIDLLCFNKSFFNGFKVKDLQELPSYLVADINVLKLVQLYNLNIDTCKAVDLIVVFQDEYRTWFKLCANKLDLV